MEGFDDRVDKKGKRAVLRELQLVTMPQLNGFDKITELVLARNNLQSLASLAKVPNLKILDVSYNKLEAVAQGELPPKVCVIFFVLSVPIGYARQS